MQKMIRPKKAQIMEEVFKYAIVGVFSVIILVVGYIMTNIVKERACKTEIARFEIDLRNIDKSLRYGTKELQRYDAPCEIDKIYFFDLNKNIDSEIFKDTPLIKDSLISGSDNNIFLVKDGDIKRSFYAGNLNIAYPYHICFIPKFDKISFFAEGAGKSVKVTSECNQPECTFIPSDISEELSGKIIKEAVEFGCRNCPTDFDKETEKIKLTKQNVEVLRKFLFCDGITDVQIILRPKKGSEVKDFRFYEFIPKTCIDDLNKYLAENLGGEVYVKGDPLIMWYFSDLGDEKKISYRLTSELSDECKQSIQGLGVAHFIKGEKEKEQGQQIEGLNTAPTIGGLQDVTVSGLGLKKNVISNLWKYAQDKETNTRNLIYTIIDQTNSDLVDCSIDDNKHIDCNVKENKKGSSRVTVQVTDLDFEDRASFNVEVSPFCKKHERKGCVGNNVYWFDSCGNQEDVHQLCESDETCEDEECENMDDKSSKKCENGEKCGFLKLGKCKNEKCCQMNAVNPFC